jgi:Tol biopolymer transport system component/imidazolonepropionase-like amidohydrolase
VALGVPQTCGGSASAELPPAPTSKELRAITVRTSEVTQPSLALSGDGSSLYFCLLGHVFRVSASSREASQLTFGFGYDSEPAISRDGRRLAFVSDRDGSGGNIFVLDLATGRITQLTHEQQAGSPRWSPDGRTIAYVRQLLREEYPGVIGFGSAALGEVRTVSSSGENQATIVAPAGPFLSLFYTPDGRLGWAIPEPGGSAPAFGSPRKTRLQAREPNGTLTTLGVVGDGVSAAALSPDGTGVYYSTDKKLRFMALPNGEATDLATLTDGATMFAVAAGGSVLAWGDRGRLWRVNVPDGEPATVEFSAEASLLVRASTEPTWQPPVAGDAAPRAIVSPGLSRDGTRLVFMAAGFIYEQRLDGSPARRLFAGRGFERDPVLSPDGARLAYAVSDNGRRELRLHNFATRQTRTLYSVGGASWASLPSFSPDGTTVVFQRSDGLSAPYTLISIDLRDGKTVELAQLRGAWTARPHFSADGRALYFTARLGKIAALYKQALEPGAKPEPVTALSRHVNDGAVSPDGKWLAFRRNTGLWLAPFDATRLGDASFRRVTAECSRSFAFSADSSAIIYSAGPRVWRLPLNERKAVETPVRLRFARSSPPPVLLRRVRALDFATGGFGEVASILIQDGTISWVGSEQGRRIPKNAMIIDGDGRFAIPGLNDTHVHSAWANEMASEDAFIAFGNTSVRDVGGTLELLGALRDRSETTDLPAPRYWYSGEILEGAMPLWGDAFCQIATEAEARQTIRAFKVWGADLIKVYLTVPWHLQNVMAEEAQRQCLPVVGHAISFDEMVRHALQGYASVEHTTGIMYDDGRKLLAATGTRWIGTLTCEGGSEVFMREQPKQHMAGELADRFVPAEKIQTALKGGRLSYYPKEYWPVNMASAYARIAAAYRDGVKVRAGTDAMMAEVFFGLSLHWELEFFTQAGLTPLQALLMGTRDAAETVGASLYLGSLEPGKLADIVLLEKNPLDRISDTMTIWRVIKGGHVFDPRQLRRDEGSKTSGPRR